MIHRCYNKNDADYKYYGALGITVDPRWHNFGNYYEDIKLLPKFAYHQFIGAKIAKEDFKINDEETLEAIRYHATGEKDMSLLSMLVYASDKIDPLRDFDSTWLINSCKKDIYQGFIDTLIDNKKYLINHKKDIYNIFTKQCFDMYIEGNKNEKR